MMSRGDGRAAVETAGTPLDAIHGRTDLPDPRALIASLGGGADALVEVVEVAERFARMAAAWRDEAVAAAHEAGVRRREAELRAVVSASEARQWADREMTAELATAVTVSEQALAGQIAVTRRLTQDFPVLARAYRGGEVAGGHVRAMTEVFAHCDREITAKADVELTGRAARLTPGKLRTAARRWKAKVIGAEEARAVARAALADRHVELSPADDHLMWLSALLPAVQAQAIHDRLTELARSVEGAEDQRTRGQLRADAMCALLLDDDVRDAARHGWRPGAGARADSADDDAPTAMTLPRLVGGGTLPPDWARGIRPTVVVTVPVLSLMGREDHSSAGPAILEGHGPLDIETARQLAAQAPSFIRVLTHPHTGAVLSVDRDSYAPPADLRKALIVRDGTCRFPGCARRAQRCDVDHTVDYAHGGCTGIDNLAHLCRKHHRLKHHTGWCVRQLAGGVLEWTSPAGRVHITEPASTIWPPPPPPPPPPDTTSPDTTPPQAASRPNVDPPSETEPSSDTNSPSDTESPEASGSSESGSLSAVVTSGHLGDDSLRVSTLPGGTPPDPDASESDPWGELGDPPF